MKEEDVKAIAVEACTRLEKAISELGGHAFLQREHVDEATFHAFVGAVNQVLERYHEVTRTLNSQCVMLLRLYAYFGTIMSPLGVCGSQLPTGYEELGRKYGGADRFRIECKMMLSTCCARLKEIRTKLFTLEINDARWGSGAFLSSNQALAAVQARDNLS